jgi:hypothetical protein
VAVQQVEPGLLRIEPAFGTEVAEPTVAGGDVSDLLVQDSMRCSLRARPVHESVAQVMGQQIGVGPDLLLGLLGEAVIRTGSEDRPVTPAATDVGEEALTSQTLRVV